MWRWCHYFVQQSCKWTWLLQREREKKMITRSHLNVVAWRLQLYIKQYFKLKNVIKKNSPCPRSICDEYTGRNSASHWWLQECQKWIWEGNHLEIKDWEQMNGCGRTEMGQFHVCNCVSWAFFPWLMEHPHGMLIILKLIIWVCCVGPEV